MRRTLRLRPTFREGRPASLLRASKAGLAVALSLGPSVLLLGCGSQPKPDAAAFTPSAITFADTKLTTSAAAQTVTLTNASTATLTLGQVTLSDPANFTLTSNCGGTLAGAASCTLIVGFAPQSVTAFRATVTVTDTLPGTATSAARSTQETLSITGAGVAFTGPRAAVSPATLPFPQTVTNASTPPQTATLTNTGTTPLTVSAVAVAGPSASAFAITGGNCVGVLAAGAFCTADLIYHPTLASAADSATLIFTDDALSQAGSTQTVALTGSALAEVDSVTNFGDSLTCGFYAQPNDGTWPVYSREGYAGLFDTYLGVPAEEWCRQGDAAADLSRLWVPFHSAPASTGHQLYTLMVGVNDAYRYGIPANALAAYSQEVGAALAWLAIPNSDKVLGGAATQTAGTWTADSGFGLVSSDAGATLSFPVTQTVAGHNLYVVYHVWALPYGQAGKAEIAVDGVVQATADASQNALVPLPTENGTTDTFLLATVPLGGVGPHTVTFHSVGPGGSAVAMLWAGVPQRDYRQVDGAPRVLVGLITNSPSGNQTYAADIYNLQLRSLVPALAADGLNLTLVPTDRVMDPATDFADILHPNNAGHAKLAGVFEMYR